MMSTRLNKTIVSVLIAMLACSALALAGCSQGASSTSGTSRSATASAAASSSGSSASASSSSSSSSTSYTTKVDSSDPYGIGTHHAVVTVEGYDPFTIELDAGAAPVTVSNFCKLANKGFYDGLNFYRFVSGFCMQGGSSNNSAAAANDSLKPIVGEFSGNGVDNKLADNFGRGTVAMARNSDPNSATSTFFVTLGSSSTTTSSLNGLYAAFGTINEAGMETIDKIVADYLPNVSDPTMGTIDDEDDQAKITSIEIVD